MEHTSMENESQGATLIDSPAATPEAAKTVEPEGATTAPDTNQPNDNQADIASQLASANRRIHELNKENEKRRKEATESEKTALAEQGKFKELYEKSNSELEKLRGDLSAKERAILIRDVAQKFNLPDELRDRLRGETVEELEGDAKGLAKFATTKREAPMSEANHKGNGNSAVADDDFMKSVAVQMGMRVP